jgi:hypothetical protein
LNGGCGDLQGCSHKELDRVRTVDLNERRGEEAKQFGTVDLGLQMRKTK